MRVIAGKWRGRPLRAPKGTGTRPTTDRIRESMMSSVASLRGGFDGAVVLDAFAGSGALGIEALSRGAGCALFCDRNRAAAEALKANLASLGLGAQTSPAAVFRQCDVFARLPRAFDAAFDLLFLDPPYATASGDVLDLVRRLDEGGMIARDALLVYEHSGTDRGVAAADALGVSWVHRQEKRYGETTIDYFGRKDA